MHVFVLQSLLKKKNELSRSPDCLSVRGTSHKGSSLRSYFYCETELVYFQVLAVSVLPELLLVTVKLCQLFNLAFASE